MSSPRSDVAYGYGAFSVSDFGVSGVLQEGATQTVSGSSSATATAQVSKFGDATAAATSGSTSSANATFGPSITASVTSVNTSVAEQFVLKETDKVAYGGGAYGYNRYDLNDLQTIVSATSVGTTATGNRVQSSGASISASASTQADSERIHQPSAQVDAQCTATGHAVFLISVSVAIDSSSETQVSYIRERNALGQANVQLSIVANAREMWEPISVESDTWVELNQQATQWQKIA